MRHNIISSGAAALALAGLALTACTPEEYELGGQTLTKADLTEGVAYTVEVDQNTNTVTMRSLMPSSYTVLWEYEGGRSQNAEATMRYPFSGDKYAVFGVMTRSGVVYGDTCWFHINNLKAELLEDEIWTLLAGGIGQEKTWVLDLDANGTSQRFGGPVWFWTYGYTWDALHAANGDNFLDADPWDATAAISPFLADDGTAQWYWAADWAGNSWIGDAADYGEMTFDLKEGANVTVDMSNTGLGTFKGSFMADETTHNLSFSDAWPLHTPNYDSQIKTEVPTRVFQILYLNENNMILLCNTATNTPISLNYIVKGWEPEVEVSDAEATDPEYNGGDPNEDMTTTVTTIKQWQLVADAPYDWYFWDNATGSWTSNGFSSKADYGNWAPVADAKAVEKFLLTMSETSATAGQYQFTDMNGDSFDGKYTVDGNGFKFDQEMLWFTATHEGTNPWSVEIRTDSLILLQKTGTKSAPIYWFGVPTKWNNKQVATEYLCFKVEQYSNTGKPAVPARDVTVDNSKLYWGDLEGKGNFRIELSNHWDSSHENETAAVMAQDIYFDEKCVINFTVTGLGAFAESRTGFIMCSAAGIWDAQEGVNTFEFRGDGTYTATILGTATAESSDMVFLIDVLDAQSQTSIDLNGSIVNQTLHDAGIDVVVNSVKMDGSEGSEGSGDGGSVTPHISRKIEVNNDLVRYGDLEGNGNFRIQFYNCYGGQQGADAAVDWNDIYSDEQITIKFTVTGLGTFAEPVQAFIMSSAHNLWSATEGQNTFEFSGDGTYTATLTGEATANESLVFLIDCVGAQSYTSIELNGALVDNTLRDAGVIVTIDSMTAD